jgi:protein SCO1/2
MRRIGVIAAFTLAIWLGNLAGMTLALPGSPAPGLGEVREEKGLPADLEGVGFDQNLGAQVPLDLVFRDESGAEVQLGQYFGERPVLLVLSYYECPMLCTLVLNGVASALKAVPFDPGQDFEIVTVSFDPGEKPPLAAKKKANYVAEYGRAGAETAWHFLTGDEPSIQALTSAVGFRYRYDPKSDQYAHAAGIMVLTPGGQISRYLFGIEYAPKDIRLALVEASAGKIGSFVDQVLLFCYHYDPETGTYGAAAINGIRAGGVLTLVGIGLFMFLSWRRDQRARRGGAGTDGPATGGPAAPRIV